ncbi:MAG: hypothetical protein JSS66_12830 [Armatimonadetes bacterium]|nr:hypothetical protein [Armatimonadota bacterium]
MKKIALLGLALTVAHGALAQTPLFHDGAVRTNFYGPAGATVTWAGQDGLTNWVSWPERGAEIVLAQAGPVDEISVGYLNYAPLTGGETITVRVYANDGPSMNAYLANGTQVNGPYPSPGTLLFTGVAPVNPIKDDAYATFKVPHTNFPQNVTVTCFFSGGFFNTGNYATNLTNGDAAGFRFNGTPTVGSAPASAHNVNAQTNNGRLWRRVQTPSGWSPFACNETTAFPPYNPTTPAAIPYCMAVSVWQGSANTYDNTFQQGESGAYRALPELDQLTGAVSVDEEAAFAHMEGDNLAISQATIDMAGDTTQNPNATFRLRLYSAADNGAKNGKIPGTVIWESPDQSIPNGLDPNTANTFTAVVAVPNVVVPREFFWGVKVNFGNPQAPNPGNAGLTQRITSTSPIIVGQVAPKPGLSSYVFYQYDIPSATWGGFFYPPNGWASGGPGFQVEYNGEATVLFNLTSPTETLIPSAQHMTLGQINSGDFHNLSGDDGSAERVCRFILPNRTSPFVVTELTYTTTKTTLSAVQMKVKAKMTLAGQFAIKLGLKDQTQANVYDVILPETSIGTAYTVYTGNASGSLAKYRGTGGVMNGQISLRNTGPVPGSGNWCTDIDYAWLLVSGS